MFENVEGAMAACEFCGAQADVLAVTYRQNTGMLVARQSRTWSGQACRGCSSTLFRKTLVHNLIFGWWGMISIVLTPIFILSNLSYWVRSRSLPNTAQSASKRLEDQREYAINLLQAKDPATVVEVLSKSTGLPTPEVEAYVRALPARRP
jgi:hypothetical protein